MQKAIIWIVVVTLILGLLLPVVLSFIPETVPGVDTPRDTVSAE